MGEVGLTRGDFSRQEEHPDINFVSMSMMHHTSTSYVDVFALTVSSLAFLSILSLNLSPNESKCGLITIVYLTNSLHTIYQPISIPTRHQSASTLWAILLRKLCIRFRNRTLIRYCEHAHPAAEDPKGISSVKRLRATVALRDCQRPTLSRADTACREGNPIYLVFENGGLDGY